MHSSVFPANEFLHRAIHKAKLYMYCKQVNDALDAQIILLDNMNQTNLVSHSETNAFVCLLFYDYRPLKLEIRL